jgi:hypothetical protein
MDSVRSNCCNANVLDSRPKDKYAYRCIKCGKECCVHRMGKPYTQQTVPVKENHKP